MAKRNVSLTLLKTEHNSVSAALFHKLYTNYTLITLFYACIFWPFLLFGIFLTSIYINQLHIYYLIKNQLKIISSCMCKSALKVSSVVHRAKKITENAFTHHGACLPALRSQRSHS